MTRKDSKALTVLMRGDFFPLMLVFRCKILSVQGAMRRRGCRHDGAIGGDTSESCGAGGQLTNFTHLIRPGTVLKKERR